MPVIDIEYDAKKLTRKEITALANAVNKIVSATTGIDDVPVYAHSSDVAIKAAPVEIFIRISDYKVRDEEGLLQKIGGGISYWKKNAKFRHQVNLTLIPMHWKVEVNI